VAIAWVVHNRLAVAEFTLEGGRSMKLRGPGLETGFNAILLGLGALIAYVSWGYGFGSLQRPGPGLYPFFVGAVIVACSAVLIGSRAQPSADGEPPLNARSVRTLVLMSVTFCLWILAMPLLGYVLVTFLATYAFCKALALEGWRKPLVVSGATAFVIYLLFGYWLHIDLPRGMFFE
jgi:hypothetical protein